ncbi:MAG: hypothetical protein RL885_23555, partial [Planctomycetota bacterium]
SITNTKDHPSFNSNTHLNGVVEVHFIYIDGDYWTEFGLKEGSSLVFMMLMTVPLPDWDRYSG